MKFRQFFFIFITLIILGILGSCGVPDYTSANLNNLNRPQLSVYNTSDTVVISITGFYPSSQYPDFIGYNVYVGENNDPDKVVKRILYDAFPNDLPTVNAPAANENYTTTLTINSLVFRFTDDATDTDLLIAGATKGQLYERNFKVYEKYYFIAEAIEVTGRKGLRTDPVEVVFLNYQTDLTLNFGNELDNVGAFDGLVIDTNSFEAPSTDGYVYSVYSVGSRGSIFGTIPKGSGYAATFFKPYDQHIYYFEAQSTSLTEYLAMHITATNINGVTLSYGHEKEIVTDLNEDISAVN